MNKLLAIFLCLAASTAMAKDLPSGKPEREGFSSERLTRISAHMTKAVADGTMVGGMAAIARNGKVIFRETLGAGGPGESGANGGRHDFPHLLHEQAHYFRCADDTVRGGQVFPA